MYVNFKPQLKIFNACPTAQNTQNLSPIFLGNFKRRYILRETSKNRANKKTGKQVQTIYLQKPEVEAMFFFSSSETSSFTSRIFDSLQQDWKNLQHAHARCPLMGITFPPFLPRPCGGKQLFHTQRRVPKYVRLCN